MNPTIYAAKKLETEQEIRRLTSQQTSISSQIRSAKKQIMEMEHDLKTVKSKRKQMVNGYNTFRRLLKLQTKLLSIFNRFGDKLLNGYIDVLKKCGFNNIIEELSILGKTIDKEIRKEYEHIAELEKGYRKNELIISELKRKLEKIKEEEKNEQE